MEEGSLGFPFREQRGIPIGFHDVHLGLLPVTQGLGHLTGGATATGYLQAGPWQLLGQCVLTSENLLARDSAVLYRKGLEKPLVGGS